MKTAIAKALQMRLQMLGHYKGKIDGQRGPKTAAAVDAALRADPDTPAEATAGWSDLRKANAVLQLWCKAEGIDCGKIDGLWGPQTEYAVDTVIAKMRDGVMPEAWRDQVEAPAAAERWPLQRDLASFYGPPGKAGGSQPSYLVKVPSPWKLKIAWSLSSLRTHLIVHEKLRDSLAAVLEKVHSIYGEENISRLGLDLFGGDYNARAMRGGTKPSTHSWGIAFDFDPAKNPLKANRATARFAHPDYEDWWKAWEDEGWVSLGRARNFDWMHVQAARL
jgi:hypothetical protein